MGELHKVITEILGGLIVLGALLVLIMRRVLQKGKDKKQEAVEVSANRLRYELERSGDAIIGRMQIHVERLEHLLAEANQKQAALDERLRALQQWEAAYGARLGMIPQQEAPRIAPAAPPPQEPLVRGREQAPAPAAASFQTALAKSMGQAAVGGSIDLKLPPEEAAGVQGIALPPARSREAAPAPNPVPAAESVLAEEGREPEAEPAGYEEEYDEEPEVYEEEEAADDEAYEYEEEEPADEEDEYEYEEEEPDEGGVEELTSAEEDEYEAAPPDSEVPAAGAEDREAPDAHEGEKSPEAARPPVPEAAAPPHMSGTLAARQQEQIRSFLRQGLDVEEISRRLGLGRGAIELIRHMERRAQEAKDAARNQDEE